MIPVIVLLLMGLLASVASFFLKKSTAGGLNVKKLLVSPYLYLGGVLYVLSALLNLYLLKRLPYSVVVPLGALTYIWTLMIANRFLGEAVTKKKILGIVLILAGVSFVAGTH